MAPETPGSIHEGGELGYSLAHAFGAVADNPDLIAACVVGDGEAETGPLATSWHGNKFMNPITDGAVLPILHLNGFKIANPTIFSRMSHEEVESFFRGCGWEPRFVEGSDPAEMHQKMAATVDWAIREIKRDSVPCPFHRRCQPSPLAHDRPPHPQGLDRPQGGGRPRSGGQLACPSGAHFHGSRYGEAPAGAGSMAALATSQRNCSTRTAPPWSSIASLPPAGTRRMGANPHANGGLLLRDLRTAGFPGLRRGRHRPRRRGGPGYVSCWAPMSGT